jgi:hypothetical protein
MAVRITDIVRDTVNKFDCGYVFTAREFLFPEEKHKTVCKLLDNMVATKQIRRLSKGRFYKPLMSDFDELPLDTFQIVKDLVVKNGKTVGYLTGNSIFNELGLTSQIQAILQIATYKVKKSITRGNHKISFIVQSNAITKETIPLLQLLDCLRLFKNIPETTPDKACQRLLYLLKELEKQQLISIKKLSLNYTPQTMALFGAVRETINPQEDTELLFSNLNPKSNYKLSISQNILPTQKRWNIR